jgi:hypothetical protein
VKHKSAQSLQPLAKLLSSNAPAETVQFVEQLNPSMAIDVIPLPLRFSVG